MERRQYDRYSTDGLVVMIDSKIAHALDISIGGLRIERKSELLFESVHDVKVVRKIGDKLDLNSSVGIMAQVIRVNDTSVALQFLSPSYDMLRFIVDNVATTEHTNVLA